MSQLDITGPQLAHLISHGNWSDQSLNSFAEAIRYRRAQMQYEARRTLQVGSEVAFHDRRFGRTIKGTVLKVAIKYATVRDTLGARWRVPMNMLETV